MTLQRLTSILTIFTTLKSPNWTPDNNAIVSIAQRSPKFSRPSKGLSSFINKSVVNFEILSTSSTCISVKCWRKAFQIIVGHVHFKPSIYVKLFEKTFEDALFEFMSGFPDLSVFLGGF